MDKKEINEASLLVGRKSSNTYKPKQMKTKKYTLRQEMKQMQDVLIQLFTRLNDQSKVIAELKKEVESLKPIKDAVTEAVKERKTK